MPTRLTIATAVVATVLAAAFSAQAAPAYKVAGSVSGPDGGWDYASFDPALKRVYVSHADSVFAVDATADKALAPIGAAPHGHKIVPLDGGLVLGVTVGGDNSFKFIDARSGATLASVPTGVGPDSAMYDAKNGLVIVAAHKAGEVDLIDPKSRKSVGAITVGGTLEELAVDSGGRLFVNVENKNEMVAIDLKTRKVEKHIALPGCDGPTGLVYAPDAHVVVAACDGKAVAVDTHTMTVAASLTIGAGPDSALYDPKRHLVLIPCGSSGELAVIDARAPGKLKVVGRYPTEKSARTGAIDPDTGTVYLPAARFSAPAAGERRGKMEPGSFHILVVKPTA
jgi:DNA-binding beta-propeller fold protein YncE